MRIKDWHETEHQNKLEKDTCINFKSNMESLFPKGPKSTFHSSEKIAIFFE